MVCPNNTFVECSIFKILILIEGKVLGNLLLTCIVGNRICQWHGVSGHRASPDFRAARSRIGATPLKCRMQQLLVQQF
jgi:hypothetical protein